MREGASTATQIVIWNSSGFRVNLNRKYNVIIIDIHARTEFYFTLHKPLSCELNIQGDRRESDGFKKNYSGDFQLEMDVFLQN